VVSRSFTIQNLAGDAAPAPSEAISRAVTLQNLEGTPPPAPTAALSRLLTVFAEVGDPLVGTPEDEALPLAMALLPSPRTR
jgi:hypothetical protein